MTYCFSAMRNKHSLLCDLSSRACQELRSNKALLAKNDGLKKYIHLKCCISLLKANLLLRVYKYNDITSPPKNLWLSPT